MGPYYLTAIVALLGPIRRVAGFTSAREAEREIMVGPHAGERFAVTTPTHAAAAMELDGGVTANLVASFEANERYVCDFEVHGTDAVLRLPDPNAFGGDAPDPPEPRTTGRRSRTPRAAGRRRRGASACRTWSRRSPRAASIAPRAGSAST